MSDEYLRFREFCVNDDRRSVSQEESIAFFLAFAGIHTHSSKYDVAFGSGVSEYTQVSEISELIEYNDAWQVNGDHSITGIGQSGSGKWHIGRLSEEIGEKAFIVEFDKTGSVGAFAFGLSDSNDGYLVWWNGSELGLAEVMSDEDHDTTTIDLCRIPCTETGNSSMMIGIHYLSYSKIDQVDDLGVTVYMDGKQILAHATFKEEVSKKIGFAVWQDNAMTIDNVKISHAHRPVDWSSVDPGEATSAGLGRVLAHTKLKILARYDGTVLIRRHKITPADWTIDDRDIQSVREKDVYSPSHMRLVGALHEYDSIRESNAGHVFEVANDPNALTYDETQIKSDWYHARTEEQSQRRQVAMAPQVLLEPGDIISIDGVLWRIESINYEARWSNAPILSSGLNLVRSSE